MARTKGAIADKLWSDAIRLAVMREEADNDGKIRKRISIIADKLCKAAMDGDTGAMKEIGDRLDGRPMQAVQHSGDGDNPIIHRIEREIVTPENPDS